jgi:hypothetical protein
MARSSYLSSPSRAVKKGRLAKRLRRPDGKVYCQLCGQREATDFHEILSRGLLGGNEAFLAVLPTAFHAWLCSSCNHNQYRILADSKAGRDYLLAQNTALYGKAFMRQKIAIFNRYLFRNGRQPISVTTINYQIFSEE